MARVYVDVGHDATGRARRRVLALHFLYPLIFTALRVAYEVLVEEGYDPEAALMELHGSGEVGEVLLEGWPGGAPPDARDPGLPGLSVRDLRLCPPGRPRRDARGAPDRQGG